MQYIRTPKQIDLQAEKILNNNLKDKVIREQIRWSCKTMFPADMVRLVVRLHTLHKYDKRYTKFSFHKLIDALEGDK